VTVEEFVRKFLHASFKNYPPTVTALRISAPANDHLRGRMVKSKLVPFQPRCIMMPRLGVTACYVYFVIGLPIVRIVKIKFRCIEINAEEGLAFIRKRLHPKLNFSCWLLQ
jgi:hypothetical protein